MEADAPIRVAVSLLLLAAVLCAPALGASAVQGLLISDGVTGRTTTPHGWVQEEIYLGQLGVGFGAGGTTIHIPPGWYRVPDSGQSFVFPGGTYALFTLRFDGTPAFSLRTDLAVPAGGGVLDSTRLTSPAHYSVMYNEHYNEWGSDPWLWGDDFYQTFTATSQHITRVGTKLAGKSGDHYSMTLNFAIYEVNAGSPSTWPRISQVRSRFLSGGTDPIIHIFWVPYRSNEMELVPGRKYAARFWRAPGSQSTSFAIVTRRDTGNGYAGGQLYSGDEGRADLDAYAYISGGEAGTVVDHAPVLDLQVGDLFGGGTRFGQTFVASGISLAGADTAYATGEPNPASLLVTFQLYDSVGGRPIGPAKKCYGIPGLFQARAAAVWQRGEVLLVPGQKYYLEWSSSACNSWRTRDNLAGEAYVNGVQQGTSDLLMSIAEYVPQGPIIGLDAGSIERTIEAGDVLPDEAFTVRNAGDGEMCYTIEDNVDWLSVSPTSGCTDGDDQVHAIHYDTAGLSIGIHVATLTIRSDEALNSPRRLTVTMNVLPIDIPGDFDYDGDVDMEDFGHLQACLSGSGVSQLEFDCIDARLDSDEDVDIDDYGIFQSCFSGPNIPADRHCAG